MVSEGNHPQMALLQASDMLYSNLPRYMLLSLLLLTRPCLFCWLNMMAFAHFLHYVFRSAANKNHPYVRRSCSHMCLPENSPENPMVSHQFSSVNSKFTGAKLSIFRHIHTIIHWFPSYHQWPFQEPKLEVPIIYKAYF